MNIPFMMPAMLLLLQSNDAIARALQSHSMLPPDQAHYGGMLGSIGWIFLTLIVTIGNLVQNYGLAILLSCVIVRLAMLMLTRQQIYGMKTMQMLQPVMKAIQRYYPNKNDQSAKTMELYTEYKINPVAGCLPMFIQLPIMFGVYRALYDASFAGKEFLGIQLLFPVNVTAGRNFGGGPDLADLIDLTVNSLHLQSQIMHIPARVPVIGGSFWYWPALILVVLYAGSSFFLQQVMKRVNAPHPEFEAEFKDMLNNRDGTPQQPDIGAQMAKQMGLMNIMIVIFAFIFSSGALLYFIMQNMLMALEYTLLPRTMQFAYDAKELRAFVRRPPAPLKTAVPAKARPQEPDAPGANLAPGTGGVTTESNQADSADEEAPAQTGGVIQRPRRSWISHC